MKQHHTTNWRVLGIAPSSRGFGFAVMERGNTLVDWGVKTVKGDKNARCLSSVANLMAQFEPDVIALEDSKAPGSRRASRIQELIQEILQLAENKEISVKMFSRRQIKQRFLPSGSGTKHELATLLANRFPEELSARLPKKRRLWTSEDHRMDIFDAVALVQHCFSRHRRETKGK